MVKEILLSLLLFGTGLGFIFGFEGDFQQIVFASICMMFLSLPLYMRITEAWQKFARSNKKQKATV